MPKKSTQLKCRTCCQRFAASKMLDGGWHIAFDKKPPSTTCRSHIGSALCRWEVQKRRRKLWEQVARAFDGRPAAFLTMVPPRRLVAYHQVAEINLENEKRAMRRVLRKTLPKATVAVSIFDISLADDTTGDGRLRYWVPHFHVAVAGMAAPALKKACRKLYKATEEVEEPHQVKDAPTPKNALSYSLKHIDDVGADAIFKQVKGSGNRGTRPRWMKADERRLLEDFVRKNPLGTYIYLMGFRRPGQIGNKGMRILG